MKHTWGFIFFLMAFATVQAQLFGTHTINVSWPDVLSQSSYTRINNHNVQAVASVSASTAAVIGLTNIIDAQYEELYEISPFLAAREWEIRDFILGGDFKTSDYDSYGYIKKKYPIVDLTGDIVENKIIRTRLYMRLRTERDKVDDYLNFMNPIPEGERILLILDALENVINTALENETY